MMFELNGLVVLSLVAGVVLCHAIVTSRLKGTTAFVVAPPVVLLLAYSCGLVRPPCPRFASRYGYPSDRILPRWRIADPIGDEQGNWAILERATNLLVIVTGDESTSLWPQIDGANAFLDIRHSTDNVRIAVPLTQDRILVYDEHGALELSLAVHAGEAQEIYDRLGEYRDNFRTVLAEALPKQDVDVNSPAPQLHP